MKQTGRQAQPFSSFNKHLMPLLMWSFHGFCFTLLRMCAWLGSTVSVSSSCSLLCLCQHEFHKRESSSNDLLFYLEMFSLYSTLNFGIPPVLVIQLEVYDNTKGRQTSNWSNWSTKGTTARWYSNKTSLSCEYEEYFAKQCDTYTE